ncbi:right-handed parallel beta-helix repeat-containing protein [Metabacillus sp. cB07]|uniref:right-handed parallel beta-helix repeat-containing protein n=1 Tax=Metabacillus sp. cB07 TaxID=2806989 RepID=UPI0019395C4B|nr:right-handed parallel beta-helix repeat-containing protein [Metabacillus sp. cB07]
MYNTSPYYVVELNRWNIKSDGTDAVNTVTGINQAFKWANDNNFLEVILPAGVYLIAMNASVLLQSNTHYKFYGCQFIIESNNLSGYSIISCDGVKNVTVEGAILKGDRETHNYSSGGTHEWGYGLECKNSCYNITIKNCEAFECTGDGFATSMDFSAIGGVQHPAHFAKGDVDSQGNIDISRINYTTVTKYFDVTAPLVKSVGYFYYAGDGYGGYGTGSNLNKTPIKVHFYKEDGSYLGFKNIRSYEFMYLESLPVGTVKVRFSFLQNYDAMNGNLHYVMCARIPQYIFFINCKSYRNRRLGASINGGRFITFESCEIFNNSNRMLNSSGTNPGYGIDVEDGYMTNQKITLKNCNIYDNRAGAFICISTRGVHIENNKFRGSFVFSGSGDDYLSINNTYYGGISGRSITSGNESDGTFCTFRNDSIFGEAITILSGNTTLDNCVFSKSTLSLSGETVKLFNCKLTFDDPDRNGTFTFSSKNVEIHDSIFDIRRSNIGFTANYNTSDKVTLSNVKFITVDGGGGHYVGTKKLFIDQCEFIHIGTAANYSRMMVSENMVIKDSLFKNLSLRIDGGDIYGPEKLAQDTGYVTHVFKDNKFIWDVPYSTYTHEARGPGIAFLYIPRLEVSNNIFSVIDKGTSLGSMYTLRIFTENYLKLVKNTITTSKSISSVTKGTITLDGAFRKANSVISIPKTNYINLNNEVINSEILLTNSFNKQTLLP